MATTPAIAPPRESKRESPVKNVGDLLRAPATMERFKAFTPKALSAERLFKVAVLAVNQTPKLAQATPVELMRAMMGVTGLGLEINSPLQHAWLIPYEVQGKIRIQVVLGYQGMIELAYRSGKVKMIMADVATKAEVEAGLFEYNKGTDSFLKHRYHPDRDEDKDEAAYAWAMYEAEGEIQGFVVMPWSKVIRIRNASSGYRKAKGKGAESAAYKKNPWVAEEWAMGMKSAIRQLFKIMPKSAEMAEAAAIDEASERGEDLSALVDLDPGEWHTRGEPEPQEEDDEKGKPKEDAKPKAEPKKGAGKAKAKPKEDAQAGPDAGSSAVADKSGQADDDQGGQAEEEAGAEAQDDQAGQDDGQGESQEGWGWDDDAI